MERKWSERLFSLFLMAVAVSAYWQTFDLPQQTESIAARLIGPAFYPQALSILFFIGAAIIFVTSYLPAAAISGGKVLLEKKTLLKIFLFMAAICMATILIPWIGWLPAQFLMVIIIEVVFDKKKWTTAIAISMIAMIAIYVFIEFALGVRLPRGFLE